MIILVGALVVTISVFGGFIMGGGQMMTLMQISEFVVICGAALGALIIMSPRQVLKDMVKQLITAMKGSPYGRASYQDLFKALYELFLLARRNGMIALEEHIGNPATSAVLTKYPSLLNNERALRLLCDGLRPI